MRAAFFTKFISLGSAFLWCECGAEANALGADDASKADELGYAPSSDARAVSTDIYTRPGEAAYSARDLGRSPRSNPIDMPNVKCQSLTVTPDVRFGTDGRD